MTHASFSSTFFFLSRLCLIPKEQKMVKYSFVVYRVGLPLPLQHTMVLPCLFGNEAMVTSLYFHGFLGHHTAIGKMCILTQKKIF